MSAGDRTIVNIAEMAVSTSAKGRLVTHALGSCIGVSVFDPVAKVGGLLHFMLPAPNAEASAASAAVGPHAYGSSAVPALFRAAYAFGAQKERMIVCAAGGSERLGAESGSRIGARNWAMLRKLLWKNGINIAATDIGGESSRNMSLNMLTGDVEITVDGESQVLYSIAKAS